MMGDKGVQRMEKKRRLTEKELLEWEQQLRQYNNFVTARYSLEADDMAQRRKHHKRVEPDGVLAGLKNKIIGQDEALERIAGYVETFMFGLTPRQRPAGVFLLLGPTGVGKTYTAEVLSQLLHGDQRVLTINCGEYTQEHEIARLIGAPPGYLGHRETQAILSTKNLAALTSASSNGMVILLDEVEKAARSVHKMFLNVFDKGKLALGDNTQASLENAFIFMTSNLGTSKAAKNATGFSQMSHEEYAKEVTKDALQKHFPTEFLNRIDEIITYNALRTDHTLTIANKELDKIQRELNAAPNAQYYIKFTYKASVPQYIADKGRSLNWGAREIKRLIRREIVFKLPALLRQLPKVVTLGRMPVTVDLCVRVGEIKMALVKEAGE